MWGVERLLAADLGHVGLWCTSAVADRVSGWPFELIDKLPAAAGGLDTLVVVGGGSMIDRAKAWRIDQSPGTRLVAVPSLWGSGAEASPVVVLDGDEGKIIRMGAEYLPDIICYWPELAGSVSEARARWACGDTWAHALEGFLSPLADNETRAMLAGMIDDIVALPVGRDARWFVPSGAACAGQARAGVGLIHGIAHTLEPVLRAAAVGGQWGHARLCATFAWPVMEFNRARGDKWVTRLAAYDLDEGHILHRLRDLYDEQDYAAALPHLEAQWIRILRDPCSRTNSTLVRPGDKAFFSERTFT